MKTKVIALMTLMTLCMLSLSFMASAKDVKKDKKEKAEVTFLVSMTCEKCQKRIEENLSFEKGVTKLNVNLPKKTVTVEYRKDKTSEKKLKSAISKLGYTVTVLPGQDKKTKQDVNRKR